MTIWSRETRTPLLILAALVSITAVGTLAVGALGATPATPYDATRVDAPDPQVEGRWAERLAAADDIDDDGVNDFFVAAPFLDVNGPDRGRVYLLSGRTGEVLRRFNSPEPQNQASFGFFISAFGDANGDSETDIAIGTDAQDVGGNKDQGKAWVFSGADGKVLYDLDNPAPQPSARFGSRIGRAGDLDGDDVSEVIVGASNNDIPAGCGADGTVEEGCFQNVGQAFVFDGKTGKLVRTLDIPANERPGGSRCESGCGSLGLAVQGPGDTNRDGVTDQLVDAGSYNGVGRMYVFSGKTGGVRLRIDSPQPERGQFFGFQDAAPLSPGDVNGDGRADLYGNGFAADGPAGEDQGRAWLFNGRNGAVIRQLDDPSPTRGGQFGWSLAETDFNDDGRPDQYIGQAPHHVPDTEQNGGTYIFDGRDGSVFKRLELPAPDRQASSRENAGPRLGWAIAAPGDLNRDGEPDYLAGAPFADVDGRRDQGRLYMFLSRLGGLYPPIDRFGGTSVWSVREGERFFLAADRGGSTRRLSIRSRGVPFDVDLGPDEDGDVVAAYSRCDKEPEVPTITSRLYSTPVAAYSTGRGCDIYRYDFASGKERKLRGASTNQASEFLPSIWRDDVAFGRVYERRADRRGVYPYLYVRALEGGRSDRQPGGARGVTGLPGPTSVDLYGRRLSFVWNYARRDTDKGTQNDDEGTTQVRLDTIGRGNKVISQASFGEGTYASFLTPKGSNGWITYGFQRVADLENSQVPRSISSILLRYKISNGDKGVANPPGTLVASSAVENGQLLIHVPERFGPAPFGQILEADDTRFVD